MATDPVKAKVLEVVQAMVHESTGVQVQLEIMDMQGHAGVTVEVNDISVSETQLRVAGAEGPPRYFMLKVTEQT